MWDTFPLEVKEKIIEKVEWKGILSILLINRECRQIVSARLQKYLLGTMLEDVVRNPDAATMMGWKSVCYDRLPQRGPDREVVLCAFFFLMGKHQNYATSLIQCFDPFIIASEYHEFYTLGSLFRDICHFNQIPSEALFSFQHLVDRNPEVNHPLFGKITVHNAYFRRTVQEYFSADMKDLCRSSASIEKS